MKLFGNSSRKRRNARSSSDAAPARREPQYIEKAARAGMSGKTKGIILLSLCICIFFASVVACLSILYSNAVGAPSGRKNPNINANVDPNSSTSSLPQGEDGSDTIPDTNDGIFNILICGTDGDGGRTDTIIVANLDTGTNSVSLMSIPRDTYIYGNYYLPKINSVYGSAGMGEKGVKALIDKIGNTFGIWVDGYVLVDLEAFEKIVDMVGGVYVEVPMNMNYDDPTQDLYIHLQKGWQTLDGAHAIQLCRYRSGYATADIRRTEVQQDFLKALAKKCIETVSISQIPQYAKIFADYVRTDLTIGNIIYFAQRLTKCNFDEMYTVTLPGEGVRVDGGDYYELYPNATLKILNEHFNPDKNNPLSIYDLNIRQAVSSNTSDTEPRVDPTDPKPEPSTDPTVPTEPEPSTDPTVPTDPEPPTDPPTDPTDTEPTVPTGPEPTDTEPTTPEPEPTETGEG